jgi:hypothetical protein
MKKALITGTIIIVILTSCENLFNDPGKLKSTVDEYLFKADSVLLYKYSDFELYDSSTHIFYFKTNHPEFKTEKSSTFSLLANEEEIYKGVFWPPYSSSLPYGAYISSFYSLYPDYTFRIEFVTIDNKLEDTRNDPRIISALKDHNLLHSGLSGEIKTIVKNGTKWTFSFVVTNKDKSDLLILDPDKMGPNLFHYFTNAPVFYNITQKKRFSAHTEYQIPSPWNSWNPEWLSLLKSGESRQFTFIYTVDSPLSPGEYKVSYEFPGLSMQVVKDQLYQNNKRIWLGDIQLTKRMIVQ